MAKTAFVTGGTGFIGINLIELLDNEGWSVTALHRTTSDLSYPSRFPIALAEGSITDRASIERAIPRGTDVVFHVAGDTNFWSKKNAQQDANNREHRRRDAHRRRGLLDQLRAEQVSCRAPSLRALAFD